jgi:hypothetical protein
MLLQVKKAKRSIKALRRRHDWLLDRITMSKADLSFDKSERLALQIAITVLECLLEGQKVEVLYDKSRTCAGYAGEGEASQAPARQTHPAIL